MSDFTNQSKLEKMLLH